MEKKTISEINEMYDLEIDKIVGSIKEKKAEKVLLQFPEGLKPYSTVISEEIEGRLLGKDGDKNRFECQCFIWLGDCFGGCDIPLGVDKIGVDLIVQFGHSKW